MIKWENEAAYVYWSESEKKEGGPENFLNDSSSYGLMSFTVPSTSHAIIRPRAWPAHPCLGLIGEKQSALFHEEKQTPNSKMCPWLRVGVNCALVFVFS